MKKTQMVSKPSPDAKPMTKPVADGLTGERGYNGNPLSQAVMQDQPQNTGQEAGGQPSSTQGNAGTGATSSQKGAKEQNK